MVIKEAEYKASYVDVAKCPTPSVPEAGKPEPFGDEDKVPVISKVCLITRRFLNLYVCPNGN